MKVVVCTDELRRSRYAVVTRFVTRPEFQCAEARMNTGFGELGRNRTYNLLIKSQRFQFPGLPSHYETTRSSPFGDERSVQLRDN